MNRYAFDLTCPRCGSEMEHRRSLKLEADRAQAETWCEACLCVWRVDVGMTAIDDLGSLFFAAKGQTSNGSSTRISAAPAVAQTTARDLTTTDLQRGRHDG